MAMDGNTWNIQFISQIDRSSNGDSASDRPTTAKCDGTSLGDSQILSEICDSVTQINIWIQKNTKSLEEATIINDNVIPNTTNEFRVIRISSL